MSASIKIGTRSSALALWQAHHVQALLEAQGLQTELVPIQSHGETDLVTPLYEIGVQGIFTKALDQALLNGQIDLAVHSLKDVPTLLPQGLVLAATPPRGDHRDVLVYKTEAALPDEAHSYLVATSSLRRRAQWLHRFPSHQTEPLRGNINTRLQKLLDNAHWQGALFAAAGLQRIQLAVPNQVALDWMLPAPAQGALGLICRAPDVDLLRACAAIHDVDTGICTHAERQFLRTLRGGCTMPVGAYAEVQDGKLFFEGNILSEDGCEKVAVKMDFPLEQAMQAGQLAGQDVLERGGAALVKALRPKEGGR
ncbi:MAG: hydroxymethylbilane synthase [Phaeodactylibacter sp.]|nr:hydroxymethylbilane synthase [Phaeodactylibacter sp.]